MTEEIVSYGVLSLIPAILAVVLAFWTKNVIISLMASLFVGCLITAGWNPWNAMQVMFSDHLFVDMTGSSNAQTIIMMSFVGGFVALIEATGGAKAFAAAIANKVHRRSTAQTTAWLGGLAIFFSDSGNSLILGPIFRPIFDRLRISRAKLAYILDSTSSPVCILVPITGWGVYIMGIIATEFENLGIQTSDASAFVQAIPYQFYALLALVLVPLIALSKRDFGPMAKFETYVLENGPTAAELEADKSIVQSENANKATAWEMIIPLLVMFVTIFVMFIGWGFPGQNIPGSKIRIALTSGYMLATIVLAIMVIVKKIMTFTEVVDTWVSGIKKMAGILAIIIAAWGVGSVCTALGPPSSWWTAPSASCPRRWFPLCCLSSVLSSPLPPAPAGAPWLSCCRWASIWPTASVCLRPSPLPPCSPAPCLAITAPPSPIPPSCPLWPAAATILTTSAPRSPMLYWRRWPVSSPISSWV